MNIEPIVGWFITVLTAFLAAWAGAKFNAKQQEKSQRELLEKAEGIKNSLAAIARRLPGGTGYVAPQKDDEGK